MAALDHDNVSMKELHKSIGDLIKMEHSLDPDYAKELNDLFKKTIKDASDITGNFLHNLHEKKPHKEVVKKMITAFPLSLSYRNSILMEDGSLLYHRIPVHSAVCYLESLPYVLLLAKEGAKYNVGGDDGRGGLLVSSQFSPQEVDGETTGTNVLHTLCSTSMAHLNVIKELRRSNLILKKDIRDHNLLIYSCDPKCEMIFHYLADWDPTVLKENVTIHSIMNHDKNDMENFPVLLKAAFRHYPEELDFLFQKNHQGITVCEFSFMKYGKDKTFRAIGKVIPFHQTTIPILHHVVEKAPHLLNDFAMYYPSAMHLRDSLGRKVYQAKLACGNTKYRNSAAFFAGMHDFEIAEIDPETDLYPFMVAASGRTSDLSAVNYLLRRNPALANTSRRKVKKTGRKRKQR
jgi:hypothetical protein